MDLNLKWKVNNNSLMIPLKQHTPMWHFQGDEANATLRATEVKPKLDKFILNHATSEEKVILEKYRLVNPKKGDIEGEIVEKYNSLNYKLKFEPIGVPTILIDQRCGKSKSSREIRESMNYPTFFSNMKNDKEKYKSLIYHKEVINMHLFTMYPELLGIIKKYICKFFASENFGTRQSKGFGSFYPNGESFDSSEAKYYFEVGHDSKDPDFKVNKSDFERVFKSINYFHKMIRSGINERSCYFKSIMFHYVNKLAKIEGESLIWDKPTIRHHFQLYKNDYKYQCGRGGTPSSNNVRIRTSMKKEYSSFETNMERTQTKPFFLFRDALGLSSIQQWGLYNDMIVIKDSENKVQRFKSPITYKPFWNGSKYIVYINLGEIPIDLINASFKISLDEKSERKKKLNNHQYISKNSMEGMKIYPKFDLVNYFDFIVEYFTNNSDKISCEIENINILNLYLCDTLSTFNKINHNNQ
jgi:hypothetical protein